MNGKSKIGLPPCAKFASLSAWSSPWIPLSSGIHWNVKKCPSCSVGVVDSTMWLIILIFRPLESTFWSDFNAVFESLQVAHTYGTRACPSYSIASRMAYNSAVVGDTRCEIRKPLFVPMTGIVYTAVELSWVAEPPVNICILVLLQPELWLSVGCRATNALTADFDSCPVMCRWTFSASNVHGRVVEIGVQCTSGSVTILWAVNAWQNLEPWANRSISS